MVASSISFIACSSSIAVWLFIQMVAEKTIGHQYETEKKVELHSKVKSWTEAAALSALLTLCINDRYNR